jgi:hypothetical protein
LPAFFPGTSRYPKELSTTIRLPRCRCKHKMRVDGIFSSICFLGGRNNRDARWTSLAENETESDLETGMVVRLASKTIVNPIGKTVKGMLNGEIDSLQHFYKSLVEDDPGSA